jgi:hypothetical protein
MASIIMFSRSPVGPSMVERPCSQNPQPVYIICDERASIKEPVKCSFVYLRRREDRKFDSNSSKLYV